MWKLLRRTLYCLAGIGLLGGGLFTAMPWLVEIKLIRDCSEGPPSEECVTRMRAMGNIWSKRGDMDNAELWYRQAAGTGDPVAMFHLAWTYQETMRRNMADESFTAAELTEAGGPVEAALERGALFVPGGYEHETYNLLARLWYERSAKTGFAPAMNNLAQSYRKGTGGIVDRDEALRLYKASAAAGNPIGHLNVSLLHFVSITSSFDNWAARGENWKGALDWAQWTPDGTESARQFASPILERTYLLGESLDFRNCAWLRDSRKTGAPVTVMAGWTRFNGTAPPSGIVYFDGEVAMVPEFELVFGKAVASRVE